MRNCETCGRAFCPEWEDIAEDRPDTGYECVSCWEYGNTLEEYDDISQYLPPGSPVCVGCD